MQGVGLARERKHRHEDPRPARAAKCPPSEYLACTATLWGPRPTCTRNTGEQWGIPCGSSNKEQKIGHSIDRVRKYSSAALWMTLPKPWCWKGAVIRFQTAVRSQTTSQSFELTRPDFKSFHSLCHLSSSNVDRNLTNKSAQCAMGRPIDPSSQVLRNDGMKTLPSGPKARGISTRVDPGTSSQMQARMLEVPATCMFAGGSVKYRRSEGNKGSKRFAGRKVLKERPPTRKALSIAIAISRFGAKSGGECFATLRLCAPLASSWGAPPTMASTSLSMESVRSATSSTVVASNKPELCQSLRTLR